MQGTPVPIEWNAFDNTEINLYVYKQGSGQRIARSSALSYLNFNSMENQVGPVTNYEYFEIPASTLAAKGAGTYIFKVIVTSTQSSAVDVNCSLAWSQYVNTDA